MTVYRGPSGIIEGPSHPGDCEESSKIGASGGSESEVLAYVSQALATGRINFDTAKSIQAVLANMLASEQRSSEGNPEVSERGGQ